MWDKSFCRQTVAPACGRANLTNNCPNVPFSFLLQGLRVPGSGLQQPGCQELWLASAPVTGWSAFLLHAASARGFVGMGPKANHKHALSIPTAMQKHANEPLLVWATKGMSSAASLPYAGAASPAAVFPICMSPLRQQFNLPDFSGPTAACIFTC